MSARLLHISGLKKSFVAPDDSRHLIVDVPECSLDAQMQVALAGASGSGKTTFLNLIAGILQPDAGGIPLDGVNVATLSESKRDRLRAVKVGYIFQTFNLLQGYTCLENVLLGMSFGAGVDRNFAIKLLKRVGLEAKLNHRPRQLSTGQQQRVAVAVALANKPKLVLAHEPTGNLDHKNARESLALIRETCRENGAALLIVSHDREVLSQFEHVGDPPACCYAMMPDAHEWISVSAKSPGFPARTYVPVRVTGVLHVGAQRLNGMLSSIYRKEAESVGNAPDK